MSKDDYEDVCLDINISWGGSQTVPAFHLVTTTTFNANRDVTETMVQAAVVEEITSMVDATRARIHREESEMDQLRELSTATGLNLPQMMAENNVNTLPELIKLLAARG